jgi:transcription elongation factor Elf1
MAIQTLSVNAPAPFPALPFVCETCGKFIAGEYFLRKKQGSTRIICKTCEQQRLDRVQAAEQFRADCELVLPD